MSEKNIVDTIKEAYGLYESRPEEAVAILFSVLSPDVRWCSIADGCTGAEFSRERNGIEEVQAYFCAGTAQGGWGAKVLCWQEWMNERKFEERSNRQEADTRGQQDFEEMSKR